jgi:hypothetical protein
MAMELFRDSAATNIELSGTMRPLYWILVLSSLVLLCIVLPMTPTGIGVGLIAGWIALIWVAISFVRGQLHYMVLIWVAIYPYCYYFLSFPKERAIFTVDRALIVLLGVEMLIVSRSSRGVPLTRDVRISAYLWGLYLLVCSLSLMGHGPEVFPSYRLLVEGMVMPALLGLYAMRYFPLPQEVRKLHVCACVLALGVCITGLIELTTNIDLFPWNGSEPMFTDTHLRRADGPFEQQIVLSVVAILLFFFIIYLRQLMPRRISPGRAVLHRAGWLASLGAALLPMNRGLVFVLAAIAIIDWSSKHRLISRRIWAAFFGLILLATVAAKLLDPRLYDDRVSNPDNVYQRLAQHRETLRVVREYPFFGVGFGLYHDVATRNPQYMAKWNGIESMTYPHNVLMTVLSEAGIMGLIFYVGAQVFLVRTMWRLRKTYPQGWLAFLYCFLIYALTGLDYATVYFSDINLLYLFILGVICQLQIRMKPENEMASPMAS